MADELKMDATNLIVGMGEIGTALYRVLCEKWTTYAMDVDGGDFDRVDILHICFPYSKDFVKAVSNYIEQYNPLVTIVYSTVPIGTCEEISMTVVHSPVEGKHPRLDEGFKVFPRWLGCADEASAMVAASFWKTMISTVRIIATSRATEFMKLRSTAKYGVNLVWADYEAKVAKELMIDYNSIQDFDRDYNYLYQTMGMPQYQRYILDPPGGEIGGHCVVPNAELLDAQYPHPLLKEIKKMKGKKK